MDAGRAGSEGVAQGPDLDALPLPAVLLHDGQVVAASASARRLGEACRPGVPFADWLAPGEPADGDGPAALAGGERFVRWWAAPSADDGSHLVLLHECTDEVMTQAALDAVADSTFVLDHAGRPRWRSERLRRRSGVPDPVAGQANPSERIHPEDLPLVLGTFVDATPEKPSSVVVRSRSVEDDDRWETIDVVVHHRVDEPTLRGYVVQVHNLDEGVSLEAGLAAADPAWMSLTEAAPVGIVVTDVVGEPVYRNRAARELLGPDIESLGHSGRWLELAREEDRPALRAAFDRALATGERTEVLGSFTHPDGGRRWLRLVATAQPSPGGSPRGLIATLEDVTAQTEARAQLDAAEARLRHLADHDHLTGLPNRSSITARLHEAVERLRDGTGGLAVLFCDLDGFKPINDRHGHRAGDEVLAEVAARLRTAAADEAVVARLGGDEFLLLREGAADGPTLQALAERLHEHLRAPVTVGPETASLAASIGIAAVGSGVAVDPETLIRTADQAMYAAKATGAGRTVLRTIEAQAPSA
jgi:diguanylate cyclase (GGDEF)-like protein/PAS domain S-box-containing protein